MGEKKLGHDTKNWLVLIAFNYSGKTFQARGFNELATRRENADVFSTSHAGEKVVKIPII